VAGSDLLAPEQILIQKADIDQQAHRHEGIDVALELDEDIEIEPVLAGGSPV
jgi:hypothetical protein